MFHNPFSSKPSRVEQMQAQTIAELKEGIQALNQVLREEAAKHRAEIAEWRDLYATMTMRQTQTSNLPSILEEMQSPDEETPVVFAQDLFSEFARVHGDANLDLVKQEPANG